MNWGMVNRILVFLAMAIALYLLAIGGMAHVSLQGKPLIFRTGDYYNWPGGDSWQRFHEFDPRERQDAMIIGSSHAYRGYDPAVFAERGHRVFNLGSSAQTPLNTYQLIKHYLDSTNCPLLIYDVYVGTFQNSGLESTADLTQNQPSDGAALGMAWALRDLRGLNMMALRMFTARNTPYYTSEHYQGLGFCLMTDSLKSAAGPPPLKQKGLLERQQQFFEACLHLCRERGIALVVSSHYARRDRRGDVHGALAHYMDSVLAGTGIPYLDYTNAPDIEDQNWFADHGHLNGTGARIFTGQLMDSLEAMGYLRKP
ncbi:MAG: hypothetical protein KDC01_03955 [Flavobacteriales bacterium]|nr:hypothetical protein [Flavobacteriales bacterium]